MRAKQSHLFLTLLTGAFIFSVGISHAQNAPANNDVDLAKIANIINNTAPAAGTASTTNATSQVAPQKPPPVYIKPKEKPPEDVDPEDPPTLAALQNIPKENKTEEKSGMPFDIRREALKEAAISYGARGGLAFRTYQIRAELDKRSRYLDKVYDFRQLLVPAPSGLLIEPPIISESVNAMLIQDGGQQAAVSDRIYNIINNARIVSTSRTWHTYLERDWGKVEEPPDILRPENDEERKIWKEKVEKGWQEGIDQANEIFQDDLNLLMADFQGMIRYRTLLAQGMISPPYALQVDRGVTGGGNEMRVGDRAVQITGVPELITGSDQWQPANQ
jgi:defect-in-organelle-trafficking protein DotC